MKPTLLALTSHLPLSSASTATQPSWSAYTWQPWTACWTRACLLSRLNSTGEEGLLQPCHSYEKLRLLPVIQLTHSAMPPCHCAGVCYPLDSSGGRRNRLLRRSWRRACRRAVSLHLIELTPVSGQMFRTLATCYGRPLGKRAQAALPSGAEQRPQIQNARDPCRPVRRQGSRAFTHGQPDQPLCVRTYRAAPISPRNRPTTEAP